MYNFLESHILFKTNSLNITGFLCFSTMGNLDDFIIILHHLLLHFWNVIHCYFILQSIICYLIVVDKNHTRLSYQCVHSWFCFHPSETMIRIKQLSHQLPSSVGSKAQDQPLPAKTDQSFTTQIHHAIIHQVQHFSHPMTAQSLPKLGHITLKDLIII